MSKKTIHEQIPKPAKKEEYGRYYKQYDDLFREV